MKRAVTWVSRSSRPAAIAVLGLLGLAVPAASAAAHRGAARHHRAALHVRSHAARHRPPPPPQPPPKGSGYDISYPQCNRAFPSGQSFGVVGVNGGLANNANPCLSAELTWAGASPGLASPAQARASLYENAADPGNGVADWPRSGTAPGYGSCNGSWSQACAYIYGQQRAAYAYGLVAGAHTSVSPATAPWWLDVETVNSWANASNTPNWAAVNIATLQGFAGGLRGAGATASIGLYSTAYQWQAITGLSAQTSPSYFPTSDPDWVAGASSYAQAQANCSATFTGGRVALAQFPQSGFDGEYACP